MMSRQLAPLSAALAATALLVLAPAAGASTLNLTLHGTQADECTTMTPVCEGQSAGQLVAIVGKTITVLGQAYDDSGNPVPDGTTITILRQRRNDASRVAVQTVATGRSGTFTAAIVVGQNA